MLQSRVHDLLFSLSFQNFKIIFVHNLKCARASLKKYLNQWILIQNELFLLRKRDQHCVMYFSTLQSRRLNIEGSCKFLRNPVGSFRGKHCFGFKNKFSSLLCQLLKKECGKLNSNHCCYGSFIKRQTSGTTSDNEW